MYELCVGFVLFCLFFQSEIDAFSFGGRNIGGSGVVLKDSTGIRIMKPLSRSARTKHQKSTLILNGFLDGIFGGGDNTDTSEDGELSTIIVGEFDEETIQVRYDSLSDYITDKWMDLFESKSIPLTTPVKVFKRSNAVDDSDESIAESASCKLVFQKVDTGYNDKDDDDDENSEIQESKGDEPKQGGVEITVQKLISKESHQSLRVVARRCDIDEDTMIKEMSEELILKQLQKAIGVWKKETL